MIAHEKGFKFHAQPQKTAAYFHIMIVDTKWLMILKSKKVFSSFMVSYPSVQISPQFYKV